ncbi:MAG: hypothetical protein MJH10_18475 [Epibacterium sp.]|nr:hypothetical protein [Epibacterium sp.]NQX75471.1 hypothetical protein [Epibacterium sp.]
MIGVVVWTDQTFERAVIWCEDQSDLAYFVRSDQTLEEGKCQHPGDTTAPIESVRKGDMVLFDCYYEGTHRMVKNLRLLAEESHPLLAEYLQADAGEEQVGQPRPVASEHSLENEGETSAEILPFVCGDLGNHGSRSTSSRRKSG